MRMCQKIDPIRANGAVKPFQIPIKKPGGSWATGVGCVAQAANASPRIINRTTFLAVITPPQRYWPRSLIAQSLAAAFRDRIGFDIGPPSRHSPCRWNLQQGFDMGDLRNKLMKQVRDAEHRHWLAKHYQPKPEPLLPRRRCGLTYYEVPIMWAAPPKALGAGNILLPRLFALRPISRIDGASPHCRRQA